MLYDQGLITDRDGFVHKTAQCCRDTVNGQATVSLDEPVNIDAATVVRFTLDEFSKRVNKLVGQGYPLALAEKLAGQSMLGD